MKPHIVGHKSSVMCPAFKNQLSVNMYSKRFISYFLIPMVAAPWCTDPEEFARTFPAKFLIQFMLQRGLLDAVVKRLGWRSFRNGSQTYIEAFQRSLPPCHRLHLHTPVHRVVRTGKKMTLIFADKSRETFDRVVLAQCRVPTFSTTRSLVQRVSSCLVTFT
ncbi:uncharacterized protein F4817DRAFT_52655 [Daldinia loculata]|uniref:uncharacterized protein n=1 Tax=Daldinia loculata TaxID=103429 RepID=UPI0020C517B4|nr:uncharacterized protein F4817DRAFT_52655 [Daldinia loculata]KAI1641601.1 hypothetical protein F4817DRAFT_52655 [Daldinia loculata]